MPLINVSLAPPPGFVHVDLDGLWTLAGCYGFDEGTSFEDDPIFEFAVSRLLALFDKLGIKATFFIVGRDLELTSKREVVAEIAQSGHELACHGYHHRIGMEHLPEGELREEVVSGREAVAALWGRAPVGFRAPGYDAGPRLLRTLAEAGFRYDGSWLPTPWAPLLRWAASRLRGRVQRGLKDGACEAQVQGQYGDGRSPLRGEALLTREGKPFRELPLAVSRRLRLPIHASMGVMMGAGRVTPHLPVRSNPELGTTYLLHGMDLMAPDEVAYMLPSALKFHRAFRVPLAAKTDFLLTVLGHMNRVCTIQRSCDWLDGLDRSPAS